MFDPSALTQGSQTVGGQQGATARAFPGEVWEMFGLVLIPIADGTVNVNYSFGVRGLDLAAAEARRDYVLAGGIGTQTGPGFDVVFYSETQVQTGVLEIPIGVQVRQAEVHDTFMDYTLAVNGVVVSDLASGFNVLHYPSTNGWDVVETLVGIADIDTNSSYNNEARSDWSTLNRPTPLHATQSLTNQ
jgi:hypothetical protein